MTEILLVCTANICRSPYARARLRAILSASDRFSTVSVISAGTEARVGEPICDLAATDLMKHGLPHQRFDQHRARPLDESIIDRATLILTAERAHRSVVNRTSPGSQWRTFTLLEAATLARAVTANEQARGEAVPDHLSAMVEQLNSARGTAVPVPLKKPGLFRRDPHGLDGDLFTIADGHALGKREHAAVFPRVSSAIEEIGAFLTRG